ncbi:MAG: tRNA glutamyl-Q(34) synthetase GluQRS [Ruminococcaceae bacterium]|nr:tRNA glutamyl-Q(34) synthetase GluQRS [Oscillospiraceae bacterium]
MNEQITAPVVGRFAPTPSARLHLGNLMCALVAWLSARSQGGRILLRVEDLDAVRCPFMGENTRYMLDDLAWLGLTFDGEVLYQSARSEIYEIYFERLREQGLIYPCYCSRAELHATTAPHLSDNTPIYDRRCLVRAARGQAPPTGRRPAFRVMVPDREMCVQDRLAGTYCENLLRDCSDFVVRRADGVFAYQLAVVVDDALSGVSEVVRGNDLLFSTPRQMYLQERLGFAAPHYAHIPLLVDANGRRLSKRDGDGCMENVRAKYKTAAPVLGALAAALGLIDAPESVTLADLLPLFDAQKLPRDTVKLPDGF